LLFGVDSLDLDILVILTRISQKTCSFKEMTCWPSPVYRGLRKTRPFLQSISWTENRTSRSNIHASAIRTRGLIRNRNDAHTPIRTTLVRAPVSVATKPEDRAWQSVVLGAGRPRSEDLMGLIALPARVRDHMNQ
jgi:hypothetical protein